MASIQINRRLKAVFTIFVFTAIVVASMHKLKSDTLLDRRLDELIHAHNLKPLQIRHFDPGPRFILGRALFHDPILGGARSVSCASCHQLDRGLTDHRPFSANLDIRRRRESVLSIYGSVHTPIRNAPDLYNRDSHDVSALLWDGGVEVFDAAKKVFRDMGISQVDIRFQNILEIQSILPVFREDEMLEPNVLLTDQSLPVHHALKANEFVSGDNNVPKNRRIILALEKIIPRLIGVPTVREMWQLEYLRLFRAAFPIVKDDEFTYGHVAIALAHYQEMAFSNAGSPWDSYLRGYHRSLSIRQKNGAILFYGKALCATCHFGTTFSDYKFHNVGIFSPPVFKSGIRYEDLGRYAVTLKTSDLYKFRTPPLRGVVNTPPYFHDGSTSTLGSAIRRHIHIDAEQYGENGRLVVERKHMETYSPIFNLMPPLSDDEIEDLVEFLKALSGQTRSKHEISLDRVPSGLISGGRRF